jgi:hypothetical protein
LLPKRRSPPLLSVENHIALASAGATCVRATWFARLYTRAICLRLLPTAGSCQNGDKCGNGQLRDLFRDRRRIWRCEFRGERIQNKRSSSLRCHTRCNPTIFAFHTHGRVQGCAGVTREQRLHPADGNARLRQWLPKSKLPDKSCNQAELNFHGVKRAT